MPFSVVTTTTVVHTGQPEDGGSLFTIHLEDGRKIIGYDIWPHYPSYQLAIHPEYYPEEIDRLIDEAVEAERKTIDETFKYHECASETSDYSIEDRKALVTRDAFAAVINKNLREGAPLEVIVCRSYTGKEHASLQYSKVVRLEGTPEPAKLQLTRK